MDKKNKRVFNRILVSILVIVMVITLSALYYYAHDIEAQKLEPRYNEMLLEYGLIVEEHGENSIEALEYFEIMEDYEPYYPSMWGYIFIAITFSIILTLLANLLLLAWSD